MCALETGVQTCASPIALDGLGNVPKSRVKGVELELSARVVEGLTVSAAATYIDAKVRHYQGIVGSVANEVGLFDPIRGDFSGARQIGRASRRERVWP